MALKTAFSFLPWMSLLSFLGVLWVTTPRKEKISLSFAYITGMMNRETEKAIEKEEGEIQKGKEEGEIQKGSDLVPKLYHNSQIYMLQ